METRKDVLDRYLTKIAGYRGAWLVLDDGRPAVILSEPCRMPTQEAMQAYIQARAHVRVTTIAFENARAKMYTTGRDLTDEEWAKLENRFPIKLEWEKGEENFVAYTKALDDSDGTRLISVYDKSLVAYTSWRIPTQEAWQSYQEAEANAYLAEDAYDNAQLNLYTTGWDLTDEEKAELKLIEQAPNTKG